MGRTVWNPVLVSIAAAPSFAWELQEQIQQQPQPTLLSFRIPCPSVFTSLSISRYPSFFQLSLAFILPLLFVIFWYYFSLIFFIFWCAPVMRQFLGIAGIFSFTIWWRCAVFLTIVWFALHFLFNVSLNLICRLPYHKVNHIFSWLIYYSSDSEDMTQTRVMYGLNALLQMKTAICSK